MLESKKKRIVYVVQCQLGGRPSEGFFDVGKYKSLKNAQKHFDECVEKHPSNKYQIIKRRIKDKIIHASFELNAG